MSTDERTGTDADGAGDADADGMTTVDVRCTGHVRTEIGHKQLDFAFEGDTLRAFLESFFAEYDVADLLIAGTEDEATVHGWVPTEEDPPGTWKKNPEGEQTRAFARSPSTAGSTSTSMGSTPRWWTATASRSCTPSSFAADRSQL